jgi:hypothetical protein
LGIVHLDFNQTVTLFGSQNLWTAAHYRRLKIEDLLILCGFILDIEIKRIYHLLTLYSIPHILSELCLTYLDLLRLITIRTYLNSSFEWALVSVIFQDHLLGKWIMMSDW